MLNFRLFFILAIFLFSQNTSFSAPRKHKVYADARIDSFRAFLPIAQLSTFYKNGYPAYRIQVVSTNKKAIAQRVLSDLPNLAPEHKIHFTYREPYYRVRVGAFRTEAEAEPLRRKIDLYYHHKFVVVTLPENIPYKECLSTFTLPHYKYKNLMIPTPIPNPTIDTLLMEKAPF